MELRDQTFEELARLIHRLAGLVLGKEKSYLVKHRLEGVARHFNCGTFEDLLRELKSTGGARHREAVIEAITTKETSFFRDHWFYEAIYKHILPDLAAVLANFGGTRHRIGIWSAAAATGQEAYSLAMLLREFNDTPNCKLREKQVGIIASDISTLALKTAQAGHYSKSEISRGVSEMRIKRHFVRGGERWQINPALQHLVKFRRADLLNLPADIGSFHLVLCRNVLIYFDQKTRQRVCREIYNRIEPGGWLGLGSAESLYGVEERFEMIKFGRAVLYRKPLKKSAPLNP